LGKTQGELIEDRGVIYQQDFGFLGSLFLCGGRRPVLFGLIVKGVFFFLSDECNLLVEPPGGMGSGNWLKRGFDRVSSTGLFF
jgi:hypothetical protein